MSQDFASLRDVAMMRCIKLELTSRVSSAPGELQEKKTMEVQRTLCNANEKMFSQMKQFAVHAHRLAARKMKLHVLYNSLAFGQGRARSVVKPSLRLVLHPKCPQYGDGLNMARR